MKNKRLKTSLSVFILFFLLLSPYTFAHSGRTDANGGHYDSSTGEYHYHHGYPAHQHENGQCPYNFDDKTNHGNGGGGGSGTSTNNSSQSSPAKNSNDWIGFVILAAPVVLIAAYFIGKYYIGQYLVPKMRYRKLYKGKSYNDILKMVNAPNDVFANENGEIVFPELSSRYYVFISKTGKSYHRPNCNKSAVYPVLYCDLKPSKIPCSKCKPEPVKDYSWMREYNKIIAIKKTYHIQ
ncbi:MAG: YHYH domain-containing protein [Oscillospiraceae bacterium]|jgi:hypothetical protein